MCGVLCALLPSMNRRVVRAGHLPVLMPARCQLRHAMHSTSNECLTDTVASVWRPVCTLAFHEPCRLPGRPAPCAHASSLPAGPHHAQHVKLPHASPAGICGGLCALLPSMSRAVCPAGQLHVLMPARCQLDHTMHSMSNCHMHHLLAYVASCVHSCLP